MADVKVSQFADVLKVPVEKLLAQLEEAGIKVSGSDDTISEEAKLELLTHLRRAHGQKEGGSSVAGPRKITLKRKSQSELRMSGAQGRSRTVNVEVRRKRTYVKRDVLEQQAKKEQEELDRVRQAEIDRAEAEKRDAERKRQELEEQSRQEQEARLRFPVPAFRSWASRLRDLLVPPPVASRPALHLRSVRRYGYRYRLSPTEGLH